MRRVRPISSSGNAPSLLAARQRKKAALLAAAAFALSGHQAAAALESPPVMLTTSGIDHVGINVPNAEAAAAFYHDLLGSRIVSDIRPADAGSAWKWRFRWHATAKLRRLIMIATPGGSKLELFEYDTPEGARDHPHQDDAGSTHIALKALDLEKSIATLKARGLTILNDPIALPDGSRWFYFLTPWGSQMELVFPPER